MSDLHRLSQDADGRRPMQGRALTLRLQRGGVTPTLGESSFRDMLGPAGVVAYPKGDVGHEVAGSRAVLLIPEA
jgi:hypothetical protein